jgi:MFS family permease
MADQPEVIGLSQAVTDTARPARVRPLANRNFRLLWMGENVSLLGDQFYFVALPWLVFQITGSSLAFGTILMVEGIPRAVFMLIGGVVTDRFLPRAVMITSNLLRLIITVLLTLVVANQAIQLWMLFVIAFSFGLVDAFFHPAYRAMIPVIVDEDNLRASNSLMLSASQLVQIAGPGVAGVLVYSVGVMLSFAFDALTFLFTSIMLLLMRPTALPQKKASPEATQTRSGILAEIGEMLAFVRRNAQLRTLVLVVAAINLLFTGPLIVGTATLGKVRFVEGSAAFGAMLSAFGIGMLIGTLAAGVIRPRRPGLICLLLVATEGVLLVGVGHASTLITACVLLVLIGCGAGFGNVNVITLTQKNVTKEMMGRVMSLIVLSEVGLTPISNALAGALADLSVTAMFVLAGGLLTLTAMLATLNPEVRAVEG